MQFMKPGPWISSACLNDNSGVAKLWREIQKLNKSPALLDCGVNSPECGRSHSSGGRVDSNSFSWACPQGAEILLFVPTSRELSLPPSRLLRRIQSRRPASAEVGPDTLAKDIWSFYGPRTVIYTLVTIIPPSPSKISETMSDLHHKSHYQTATPRPVQRVSALV